MAGSSFAAATSASRAGDGGAAGSSISLGTRNNRQCQLWTTMPTSDAAKMMTRGNPQ